MFPGREWAQHRGGGTSSHLDEVSIMKITLESVLTIAGPRSGVDAVQVLRDGFPASLRASLRPLSPDMDPSS